MADGAFPPADELARRTVESGQDAAMRGVLDYLKDR